MRLDLATFPVKEVKFAQTTRYDRGVLAVSIQELKGLVMDDPRIAGVEFDLVSPGEDTRIVNIRDVVEPRVKVEGPGCCFPGILGGVTEVGSGRTHRLSSMAVVTCALVPSTSSRGGNDTPRAVLMDMTGPGAFPPICLCHCLVMTVELAPHYTDLDYHYAVQEAELKIGRFLAETTVEQTPQEVMSYELAPVDPSLPRAVLIQGVITTAHQAHPGLAYYGWLLRESLSYWIHPNELIDGAVTSRALVASGSGPTTWEWQNHALSTALYREHGKRFNFLGVILQRLRFETHQNKQLSGNYAAKLAHALGAQVALITWERGGNSFIDLVLGLQACEQRGIKTVLVTYEHGGERGDEVPLLMYVPEMAAVVSTGSGDRPIRVPAKPRIVGGKEMTIDNSPGSPHIPITETLDLPDSRLLLLSHNTWGWDKRVCNEY